VPHGRGWNVSAEPQSRESPENDRPDLPERAGREDDHEDRGESDRCPLAIGAKRPSHPPDRLCDDRNGHNLQPVDQAATDWPFKGSRAKGEHEEDECGWQGERDPGGERAQCPTPQQTKRETDLARGRSG